MLAEQLYYRGLGIRKEFPELNPFAALMFIGRARWYIAQNHTLIEGYPLPKKGPAIVTGNHFDESDIYKACEVSRRTGRIIRGIARKSLIIRGAIESEEYLQSLGGNANHENDYNPLTSFVLRGIGIIGALRDNPGLACVVRSHAVLNSGQILGIFLQPTRYEDCILRKLAMGAATFAKLYPDVPLYPMAFSGPPHGPDRVTVLKPFTYAEAVREHGRELDPAELTIMIADMISRALPESSQRDWETRREVEFTRLTASLKTPLRR